jgi:hypothetical protein
VPFEDGTGSPAKDIPIALALAVFRRRPFDLERSRRGSPEKIVREGAVSGG